MECNLYLSYYNVYNMYTPSISVSVRNIYIYISVDLHYIYLYIHMMVIVAPNGMYLAIARGS